ncbi:hypothetical protein EHQ68_03610 [Leptospira congkakensis]|uniref:Lipoprotein n=1 Tax=Leptospira congkakensis TaxID=2484932 RepID=A0A4Z1AHG6_9LEPT|nr:hypothetical protein [Leptospira congkakensis]TGL90528.1 hypothetical protein EHQ69_11370 [Leptospira congkakensis]TGL91535.1 hypothetical protein EHQ68_03610 [Leptospira congkakensis]TGL98588.1 hypothetical protein EHQ70_03195 [Leptospira congkakensis]
MKFRFVSILSFVILISNCLATHQTDSSEIERPEKSLQLQYAEELETKVLKVGPAQEITIGQLALKSFSNTSSRLFSINSVSPLKTNDPIEPGAIVLRKVQVDRSLEFEEGTTKFHHATFASIVEFLVVSPTGEQKRILGHSEQITSRTIPFSAEDTESKDKIATSIQSAIEEGLSQIISLKDFRLLYKSQNMFQR